MNQHILIFKKLRLILIVTIFNLISIKCNAQNKFVIDSAFWIVCWDNTSTIYADDFYGYHIAGDSIYNSVAYKKVSKVVYINQAPNWPLTLTVDSVYNFGLVREDNNKVYFVPFEQLYYCTLNMEQLIYDFSLSINDTISTCMDFNYPNSMSVVNIDTINGEEYFYFSNGATYSTGFGSFLGPFDGLGIPVSGAISFISKYCIGSIINCSNFVGIINNISKTPIDVYPVPVNNILTIKGLKKGQFLHFHNVNGMEISNLQVVNEIEIINVEQFPEVFYLQIISSEINITKKIIHIKPK